MNQPENETARSVEEAFIKGKKLGFPFLIRPSFVLGGRAMRVIHNEEEFKEYVSNGIEVSNSRPVLLDRYLNNAVEVDVDCVSDGETVIIAGVMEHIERAGIHSGDSSCTIPPPSLPNTIQEELKRQTRLLAKELKVCGLMNIQFAVTPELEIFILEVNPRASRTVPFVSKATGVPWAKVATKVMAGKKLTELGIKENFNLPYFAVKACVFPFHKFEGVDSILGPEMKSTGEVMGIDTTFAGGFCRAQYAASNFLPLSGTVFLSLKDDDKTESLEFVPELLKMGYKLIATNGTAKFLQACGFQVDPINKVMEGSPHIVDALASGIISLVINTPEGSGTLLDSKSIRMVANEMKVPTFTTIASASATVEALKLLNIGKRLEVRALQDYLKQLN